MGGISRMQYLDMDADGIKDVVTTDGITHGKVNVSYNDGNGTFISQNKLGDNIAYYARDVVFTDWDNDGNLDKIFTSSNKVSIHSNYNNPNADSLFVIFVSDNTSPYGNIGTNGNTMPALRLGDIDNDGDNDLIIAESEGTAGTKVHWFENTLNLTQTYHLLISTKVNAYEIGDMDGDNDLDFVSIEQDGSFNTVLKTYNFDINTKTFSLNQSKPFGSNNGLNNFVLADPDNDNDLDIVYSTLMWLENTDGLGTLADYAAIVGPFNQSVRVISGDIDNDGLEDFLVTNNHLTGTYLLVLYKNLGGNTFSTTTIANDFAFGSKPALIADVDYDGVNDIITYEAEGGSNRPKWYRTCFPTTFSITETVCASYTSPSGNYTWTTSDIYTDTIPNAAGCDSVVTINLTVIPPLVGTHNETVCDGGSIIVNGTTYNAGNLTGTEVFANIGTYNCDSTVTVTLTIESAIDVTVTNALATLTANQAGAFYKWLDCDNSNAPISGETDQSFAPSASGNYAVEITWNNCVVVSGCVNMIITGITAAETVDMRIYPNPVKSTLTIETSENLMEVSIYTVSGSLIRTMQEKVRTLDVSNLANGMYILTVKTENGTAHSRFVKQ
ncbi:MAG: T9SS type A sorting domain-containing protein [Flavobacteriales bacterium]|nr:T9SS type A sorting domain-containing protein [Flavobacteriales bacterium]